MTLNLNLSMHMCTGPPPEPVSDPPDKLPRVPKDAKGAEEKSTQVPSLKDLGYTQTPTTPFHVRFCR